MIRIQTTSSWNTGDGTSTGAGTLSIQTVSGSEKTVNFNISNINTLQFDSDSGFSVENSGDGKVLIKINETNALGILVIDASDDSPQLNKFLDLLENPCNYKGRVVYLTAVGPTQRPDPFLWADKFYFNEGCEWHESPFALGSILDG